MIPLRNRSWIMNHDEVLTVLRPSKVPGDGVNYEDGKPVEAPPLSFALACNVQPLTGVQLQLVPEADRYTEQFMLYGQQPLAGPWLRLQANDRVLRLGKVYQVQEVKDWGGHIEARIVLVDVGPQAGALP